MLEVGTKAPEFTLPDKDGNMKPGQLYGKHHSFHHGRRNSPACQNAAFLITAQ